MCLEQPQSRHAVNRGTGEPGTAPTNDGKGAGKRGKPGAEGATPPLKQASGVLATLSQQVCFAQDKRNEKTCPKADCPRNHVDTSTVQGAADYDAAKTFMDTKAAKQTSLGRQQGRKTNA